MDTSTTLLAWLSRCVITAQPFAALRRLASLLLLVAAPAIALTSQTITFGNLSGRTFGAAPFTVSATASSGLPVSFSSTTTTVCTVSGNTVTIVAAGSCTIRASQAGNATYAAAPNVDKKFTVAKGSQTITFGAPTGQAYGSPPLAVSATASSGLPVSFASRTTSICTVSGATVTLVTAGTCTIRASQAGNTNWNAASTVDRGFTVTKGSQTITFGALANKTIGAAPFAVSATASSGLAVTLASLTTRVCKVSGTTVTIVATGTCTLRASQAGNANWNAAPTVDQSFVISNLLAQKIFFDFIGSKTLATPQFPISAVATSGLLVSFASLSPASVCTVGAAKVTLNGIGLCTIRASQAGNATYAPAASVDQTFNVFDCGPPEHTTGQDSIGDSSGDCNRPVAEITLTPNVKTGVPILLDGSDSYDPSGGLISFIWSILQAPTGSTAAIDPAAPQPSFTPDLAGNYVFQLRVSNGAQLSFEEAAALSAWDGNAPPNARPGRDLGVKVGTTIVLDGSQSLDPEGTPLTFAWTFTAVPTGSALTTTMISGRTTATPSFTPDVPGAYRLQLQVSDGAGTSTGTVVVIAYAGNVPPMANAGPDRSTRDLTPLLLDGSRSEDPDHGPSPLTYLWSLISRPAGSALTSANIVNATTSTPSIALDAPGAYVLRLEVSDGRDMDADNVVATLAANRPPVAVDDAATTQRDQSVDIDVRANDYDPDGDALTVIGNTQGSTGTATILSNGSVRYVPNAGIAGHDEFNYTVSDGHGETATAKVGITITTPPPINQAPTVSAGANGTITLPATATLTGSASDDGLPNPPAHLTLSWTKFSGPGDVIFANAGVAATAASFSQAGTYVLRLTASDGTLSASSDVTVTVNAASSLPPDPSTVAPPLDLTVSTSIADATKFLYTGSNPIQTGVAANTIDIKRAAVVRGKVLAQDGQPLGGVKLSILDHPEFGQTLSRADGQFDLAVNGGSALTVVYQKDAFISAQRQVNAPWQDWVTAPDVMMIGYDTAVTPINLNQGTIQAARASAVTDSDGTRRATLLFPQGTTATMTLPDGTTQPLSGSISVRASEFTVGADGRKRMPAPLPPASGYTYAVELSVDEAVAAGAATIAFNQAVPFYLENFLNFPVGTAVPTGYYDRGRGVWVPSDNGVVIKIDSVASGRANLIVGTAGSIATPAELAALGITDAEQTQLASLYQPGQTLWRVPITHFSSWDCNWPFAPPPGATSPNQPSPVPDLPQDKPNCKDGASIIDCQNQTLRESVRLTGTPFSLYYASNRVPEYPANAVEIPLSGGSVPAGLKQIELTLNVAGKQFKQTFPAAPNQKYLFTWDGKDAYGRALTGRHPVSVDIGYVYRAVYTSAAAVRASFAQYSFSGAAITGEMDRPELTFHQYATTSVSIEDARRSELGAWSLDIHHRYDTVGRVLHLGDGTRRSAQGSSAYITTLAGNGTPGDGGDGGPAAAALLRDAVGVAVDARGNLYIAEVSSFTTIIVGNRIRKVDSAGTISTVVGSGVIGFSGDGGPATAASLSSPWSIAFDPNGNLYFSDQNNHRIRRVDAAGIITTVAGNGEATFGGDGGPATLANLSFPRGIGFDGAGNLYIADSGNKRVRKVDPNGIISTVAGNGASVSSGDGGPAVLASFSTVVSVAVDSAGNLYVVDNVASRVRKIDASGRISNFAGNDGCCSSGDGGPATSAPVFRPDAVSVDAKDNVYIAHVGRIRKVDSTGIITRVAGNDQFSDSTGDGGPAALANLHNPQSMAFDALGNLYLPEFARLRKIGAALPGLSLADFVVPSETGDELYVFDDAGRHLRTLHALTGALRYQFNYDAAGRLEQIQDGSGNTTTIAHDANGSPASITAPDGQVTTLSVDANGYLSAAIDPTGQGARMNYTTGGLLLQFTNPRGYVSSMEYANGRLIRDQNAASGAWNLARTQNGPNFTVTNASGSGRTTTYRVDELSTGDELRTNTLPDGTISRTTISANSIYVTTAADGTVTKLTQGPDPRFAMLVPIAAELKITTPSNLTLTSTTTRTATLSDPNDALSLTSTTDVVAINGRAYTSVYDAGQKRFTNTSPMGRQRVASIDGQGHLVFNQVSGIDAVNYTYDERGRLRGIAQGTGTAQRTSTWTYNPQGYVDRITDAAGRTTSFTYDPAGRVTAQTLPDGNVIQYGYDANGNVTSITPPSRPGHAFAYTPVDLEQTYVPPLAADVGTAATTYEYNVDKQLTAMTRPDAQSVGFGYDSGGRLATLTTPAGVTSYAYTASTGQLASITAPGGIALGYAYDGTLPKTETWSGPLSGSVTRSYNTDFNVTGLAVNGSNIAFGYDQDSLLTQAGSLAISRSANNGLITGTTLGSATTTQGYDSVGGLQNLSASYGAASLYSATYATDNLGRITQKTEVVQGVTDIYVYGYDTAGRLATVTRNGNTVSSYGYDANGNRITTNGSTATYDNQDRLVSYAGATFAYTANGELRTRSSGGQTTQYGYDLLGNLKTVALPNGTAVEYLIDGRNRRLGKKVNGALVQGFLYQDGLSPVAELGGTGNVVSRFVYGTRLNVPDYMVKGGVTYRFVADHIGSPRLIVNTNTGAIVQRMDFDEFGVVMLDTNPGFQPFGFAGGIYDNDTRLTRFGARDYDAQVGRWTIKDPIRFAGRDANLYAYAAGNPISFVDPFGLYCLQDSTIGAIGGAIGGAFAGAVAGLQVGGPAAVATAIAFGALGGTLGGLAGYVGSDRQLAAAVGGASGGAASTTIASSQLGGAVGGVIAYDLQQRGVRDTQAAIVGGAAGGAFGGAVAEFLSYSAIKGALKGGLAGLSGAALSGAIVEGLRAGNDCGCGR